MSTPIFNTEKEYQDYLTAMRVLQAELATQYTRVSDIMYVRKRPPEEGGDVLWPVVNLDPPVAGTTPGSQLSTGEATTRRLEVSVRDGVGVRAGDSKVFSTGPIRPAAVDGWANPMAARGADGVYASHALASGVYTAELVCSGFSFDVPSNAVIKGVEVKVTRRKL